MYKAHCLWAWLVVADKTQGHMYIEILWAQLHAFWAWWIVVGKTQGQGLNYSALQDSFSSPAQQPRSEAIIHFGWMNIFTEIALRFSIHTTFS